MKQTLLSAGICILTLLVILSFRNKDVNQKQYITLSHIDGSTEILVSGPGAMYTALKIDKPEARDTRPLMKVVNDYEAQGYTKTSFSVSCGPDYILTTVLL